MNDDLLRSKLFAEILENREDLFQRALIEQYLDELDFLPIDDLLISQSAWSHILALEIDPKLVFAHPQILQTHPTTSLYYRGITLLSRKRVSQASVSVTQWEEGVRLRPVPFDAAKRVASVYNGVISSIIENSLDWTLEDGHRNILATIGITLDGKFRNRIGDVAETLIKNRIATRLTSLNLITSSVSEANTYLLPNSIEMRFSSEPDIEFRRGGSVVATIEIKGGRDPAGALERLGATTKSFAETPVNCVNFLIAGVVTPEMQARLDSQGTIRVYLLDDLAEDGEDWDEFISELFHFTLRIV